MLPNCLAMLSLATWAALKEPFKLPTALCMAFQATHHTPAAGRGEAATLFAVSVAFKVL